jgi:uncharacterized protein (TIGR02145 family)
MKTLQKILLIILISSCQLFGQDNVILTFSGLNNAQAVTPDHVWIRNVTKNCDTTLPQGVLTINLGAVGIGENKGTIRNRIRIEDVTPNPFSEKTVISLILPAPGPLNVTVFDESGRICLQDELEMKRGIHHFQFTAGKESMYFLTFSTKNGSATTKLISLQSSGMDAGIEGIGSGESGDPNIKSIKGRGFVFSPGDELLLVGYYGEMESGMIRSPNAAQTITFQFANNIPCPGLPTVTYEGKVYNTVQIMSQCWLKENIDLGNQINGTVAQSDNGVIEKYCFNDDPNNCTLYGGLYQWSEMMKYINDSISRQGICPGDWHVATDLEWMLLEGTVDSQYDIGDPFWDHDGNRGFDAGKNLKSTSGWKDNGNGTDLFGFTALPGGIHHDDNTYIGLAKYACFWTSNRSISVFASTARLIDYYYDLIYRDQYERTEARSVRCIKND